ncbi:MAG: hypothetical protein U0871_26375 [Gemmataceae bacterium]
MSRSIAPLVVLLWAAQVTAADPWLTVPGKAGPRKGKKVVLVSGDEEYRSEEALPQLARSWPSGTGSTAPCCSPSTRTAPSTRT